MKRISINNGRTFYDGDEAACAIGDLMDLTGWTFEKAWNTIVFCGMDAKTLNDVAAEGIEDPAEFLARYLELAPDDLIIG